MTTKQEYPKGEAYKQLERFGHIPEMDSDEECEHGYLLNDGCPYCEKEQWGCDRYHALKDDGYYG